MSTAERAAFLEQTLAAHIDAERALHQGDITPRLRLWSHGDEVSLFGAGVPYRMGWRDVRPVFEWLGSREAGGWTIVHRHGDHVPPDVSS